MEVPAEGATRRLVAPGLLQELARSWHGTRTTLQEQPGARGGIAAEARATNSHQIRRVSFAAVCSKDDRQALIRVRPRVIHRQILAATRQQLRCFAYELRRANADDGARPHGSDEAMAEWALGPCAGSSPAARRRPETFVVEAGRLHMHGRRPAAGPARQVRSAAAPSGNAACARITGPRDSLERLCGLGRTFRTTRRNSHRRGRPAGWIPLRLVRS